MIFILYYPGMQIASNFPLRFHAAFPCAVPGKTRFSPPAHQQKEAGTCPTSCVHILYRLRGPFQTTAVTSPMMIQCGSTPF